MKAQLRWLADLHEALGVGHNRQVLHQAVAQAAARAEILLNELQTARILLAELETDRRHEPEEVGKIFRLAAEQPGDEQNPLPLYPLREG
jgi:hypothetical protein